MDRLIERNCTQNKSSASQQQLPAAPSWTSMKELIVLHFFRLRAPSAAHFRLTHHKASTIDRHHFSSSLRRRKKPLMREGVTGRQCATIPLPLGSGGTLLLELFQMHIGIADR